MAITYARGMTVDAQLLQGAVREVARLLQADGAMIYLVDEASGNLRFAYDAGITDREARRLIRDLVLPVGTGMFGTAVASRSLTITDDYPADRRFRHSPVADRIVTAAGMRSMAVAPLIANDRPLGAMGAYATRPAAFSEAQIRLLQALAEHAAAAIANQRLVAELAASEERYRRQAQELALRVETQATLQRITASITAIRNQDEVLQQVVDAAVRLLGSDGAHLTLRDADGEILRPHVMAGGMDEKRRRWLATQEFPMGGGINGLAAELDDVVWTYDYLVDPRIPHTPDDQAVARKMGLRAMAAAPLRGPEGEVFGTLAISYAKPREIAPAETELLQTLADAGAIAIQNARLYGELTESERRYRFLVENSPDLIWSADKDGRFTYMSETGEALLNVPAEELIGQHFTEVVAPESLPVVTEHWQRAIDEPSRRQQYRLTILRNDGTRIPMEINALGTEENGVFAGAHGSVRDIRERVALENDLRSQAEELARVVEVQRTLGEISRRIVEVADSGEILQQVVDASKSLLRSDGAHLTFMNEEGTDLIPMVMAGDTDPDTREWLRQRRFPVQGGINGMAASTGQAVWTDDYANDPRLEHEEGDVVPARLELGAVAVAPLRGAGGEVIGTLAITYREPRTVDPRDVALLEELAGQGSIAARNARLLEQLRESERRYRFLVDHSPDQVYEIDAEGNFTYLSSASSLLTGYQPDELIGRPLTTVVAPESRDEMLGRFARFAEDPEVEQRNEFLLLHKDGHVLRAETVAIGRVEDGRFAGIHGSTRDVTERARLEASLRQQAEELAESAEAQRTLAAIAAEISSIRDPAAVLRRTVAEARRLLHADEAMINEYQPSAEVLADIPADDSTLSNDTVSIPSGTGVAGAAIAEAKVRWTGDYLADRSFVHVPEADAWIERHGYRSQMAAPLFDEQEPIGTLTVYSARGDAFDESDAELLGALASHAAIVQTNARLYRDTQEAADELARLLEAQRSLSDIAAQLAAIRDPADVLHRAVREAQRLLRADVAQVNPLDPGGEELAWAVAHAPSELPLDDVAVTLGQGVSGTALAERRVIRTGDYVADPAFEHSPELDEYITRRGMHSVMAAPLVGGDEPIGTLTVQAARADAFTDDDAQLLDALAAQAAVAITNARLLEQLQASERRYWHLVQYSPDLVWSIDAEGRFTYLSDSLERMTGYRPDELLGDHFRVLTTPESLPVAEAGWQAVQDHLDEEQQIRITMPLSGGGSMPAEVNMVATTVDGRFAGAHGSVRDLRERERLEEDLRRQAAALAANEERASLARELHDSVTQALFSMGLTARALELLMDRDPQAARGKLAELRELQKDALAEMRTLIFELRPQALETDGLAQALRNHGAAVQGRTGLDVSVEVDSEERLRLDIEEALYRIAQEALHNVVKHANAQHARISLRRTGKRLRLTVEDDGIGFDPNVTTRGNLGLHGMRQRAERMGAELTINRRPGGGSQVRVTLLLDEARSAEAPAAGAGAPSASAE